MASNFWKRLKGLLGKGSFPTGTGLLLKPCNSIHSCFMKFIFDAMFLDANLKVVFLIEGMQPFRISPVIREAQMVLELPVGTVVRSGTKINDQLYMSSDHLPATGGIKLLERGG